MAKLLVSLGAPLQLSDGEILPPLQPNTFATCASLMVEPSLTSALVTVIACAKAAGSLHAPNASTVAPRTNLCIISSFVESRTLAQQFSHTESRALGPRQGGIPRSPLSRPRR